MLYDEAPDWEQRVAATVVEVGIAAVVDVSVVEVDVGSTGQAYALIMSPIRKVTR
jgi:hypothetical protein